MNIAGNTVGSNKPRADFNEENPASVSYIKNKPPKIILGNITPEELSLWLNTAPGTEAEARTIELCYMDEAGNITVLHPQIDIQSVKGLKDKLDALEKIDPLLRTGGTMTGEINMDGHAIRNLPDPVKDGDPVKKGYMDVYMESYSANNKTKRVSKTLMASGWSESAPFTQIITVDGLTDTLFAKAYVDSPDDVAEDASLAEETPKVTSCKRSGNQLTFRCREEKPVLNIPIIVEVYV